MTSPSPTTDEISTFLNRPTRDELILLESAERGAETTLCSPRDLERFDLADCNRDEMEIYLDICMRRMAKILWAVASYQRCSKPLPDGMLDRMTPFERGVALGLVIDLQQERDRITRVVTESPTWRRLFQGANDGAVRCE